MQGSTFAPAMPVPVGANRLRGAGATPGTCASALAGADAPGADRGVGCHCGDFVGSAPGTSSMGFTRTVVPWVVSGAVVDVVGMKRSVHTTNHHTLLCCAHNGATHRLDRLNACAKADLSEAGCVRRKRWKYRVLLDGTARDPDRGRAAESCLIGRCIGDAQGGPVDDADLHVAVAPQGLHFFGGSGARADVGCATVPAPRSILACQALRGLHWSHPCGKKTTWRGAHEQPVIRATRGLG